MSNNRTYKISALLLALTAILLIAYGTYAFLTPQILVQWSTETEFETAGYFIYRSTEREGDYDRLSDTLITASSDPLSGGEYEYLDSTVKPGATYFYILEEVEMSGNTNPEGPIEATAAYRGIAEAGLGLILIVFAFFTRRLGRQPAADDPSHETDGD